MQAPGQVQRGSGEGSEGSAEALGGFGVELGQVQQGSGEGSREGVGGFGAEPGQVQQGSGEGSREGVGGFGAEPGQVPQGSGEGLQSQVRFNRVLEKVPEKVLGMLWCRARPGSTGFRRRFRRRSGRLWCRATSGSTGFAAI